MPFAEKVVPLFRRGDHDVAVFEAFKEVEVAVRNTANAKGAAYPDSEVGTALYAEGVPVPRLVPSPTKRLSSPNARPRCTCSRRPSATPRIRRAIGTWLCLIVFASQLFDVVEQRK